MCIVVGNIKPSNTILCLKGLRQANSSSSPSKPTTDDEQISTTPPTTTTSSSPCYQVQLFYINNLTTQKGKYLKGGVMIVPIGYTNQVQIEEGDEIPFFVDIKGESMANISVTTQTSTEPPPRRLNQWKSTNSRGRGKPAASRLAMPETKKLEVVELKGGGYNVTFAPNLEALKDQIDLTKLNLTEAEWTKVYNNTKLRFGGNEKKEKKENENSYGFVVAVPRPGSGYIDRSGFSLVYWTKSIEFPTVHEQITKTAAPIEVNMDASLIGLNIAIPMKHGAIQGKKDSNKVRYLLNVNSTTASTDTSSSSTTTPTPTPTPNANSITSRFKRIETTIAEAKLPTHGILNSKPKEIFDSKLHFISYLNFKGVYLNINIPGTFISNETTKNIYENLETVTKICSNNKAKEIKEYQISLNKNLNISGQEICDIVEEDSKEYKSYIGKQMVMESYVTSIYQVPVTVTT